MTDSQLLKKYFLDNTEDLTPNFTTCPNNILVEKLLTVELAYFAFFYRIRFLINIHLFKLAFVKGQEPRKATILIFNPRI